MTNFEIYTYLKSKNGGGEPVPVPVTNPALRLMDWEGTVLKEYTAEQVASLTALPNPSSLNTNVDRDLLSFQGYNWALADIKTWVSAHEGQCLTVGAIYTTTDGQDHNFWSDPNPRLDAAATISTQKKGTSSIDNYAFRYCYFLKNINIPAAASIGSSNRAFEDCYSLASINIPDGVTSIGTNTFVQCISLKSVSIPNSITSIGTGTFNGCSSLTNVNIPDGVTSIGTGAFSNCYSLTNVNIPDSVTSIGAEAFNGCSSLASINIPDGITSIGTGTARWNFSLKNIHIPNSVTSIGRSAFNECHSLASINIPGSVTSIDQYVFQNCNSLVDFVVKGKPSLSNVNTFDNTHADLRIYVPREYLSWYEAATNWDVFYDDEVIVAIEDYIEYLTSIGIDVSEYEEEEI